MKISVALPTYDGEKFLSSLLYSIAAQTYPINELIICDDASKDQTLDLVRDFSRNNCNFEIKLVANRHNLGIVKNISKTIRLCTGQFIFLADQDDIWENYKVETILNEYKYSRCEYLISNMSIIDSFDNEQDTTWVDYREKVFGLSRSYHMNGCAVGATKRFLNACLPIPPGKGHDVWFAYCARKLNTRKYLNEPLMKYRVHTAGLSSKNYIDSIQQASDRQISAKAQQELKIYNYHGKSLFLRKIRTIIVRKSLLNLFLVKLAMSVYFLLVRVKWNNTHYTKDLDLR